MLRTTERPLRFWSVLERQPGLAATGYAWHRLLGTEFDAIAGLLTRDEKRARSVPRFDGVVGEYRVVEHGPGDVVGVGRPGEKSVPLTRDDVAVYRLCARGLAGIVAEALGIKPSFAPVEGLAHTFRVGLYRPLAGFEIPAYLTSPLEESDYRAVVESRLFRTSGGILRLAPTSRHHGVVAHQLLEQRHGLFLSLEESIGVRGAGDWRATEAAHLAVAGFRSKLLSRAAEPERGFVVDRGRFEVRLDGRRCFLGNGNEFRAIDCLAREPGVFVGTEDLVDAVWCGEEPEPNAIHQMMTSLRKKFRDKGLTGVKIEPTSGGFYRLVLPA